MYQIVVVLLTGMFSTVNVSIMVMIRWSGEHSFIKSFYCCEIHGILFYYGNASWTLDIYINMWIQSYTCMQICTLGPSGELGLLDRIIGGCIVISLKKSSLKSLFIK